MKYLIVGMLFGMIINNAQNTGRILDLINKNHIELLQLINTEKQAEIAFLESLKKAKSNRIKKGDELK